VTAHLEAEHTLDDFVGELLQHGRIVFRTRPEREPKPSSAVAATLRNAYRTYALQIPGERIAFDVDVAIVASELVRHASWALISRDQRPETLEQLVRMPFEPSSASHHLSADLLLRFVPQIHRRARGIDPSDALVGMLDRVLRQWPLSGVLADSIDGPIAPPDLGGHHGLMLLYAERLARRPKWSWRPAQKAHEYVEWVLRDLGQDRSPLLAIGENADG
jgi:hypothetical protein